MIQEKEKQLGRKLTKKEKKEIMQKHKHSWIEINDMENEEPKQEEMIYAR